MFSFYQRFIAPQNTTGDQMLFSWTHIILSYLVFLGISSVYRHEKSIEDKGHLAKTLRNLAVLMLGLEAIRILWLTAYNGISLKNIRFDWCNQICLLLPMAILTHRETLCLSLYGLSFMGGFAVLLFPLWVFTDYGGVHLMSLQSMTSHGLMVLCALLVNLLNEQSLNVLQSLKGFAIIALIARIMSRLLNVNYLLMLDGSGFPIIGKMPFPAYWLLLFPLVVGMLVLTSKYFDRLVDRSQVAKWTGDLKNYKI